jgi:hypothetical protein
MAFINKSGKTRTDLFLSMIGLLIIVIIVGLSVNYVTSYFRSQDPIYQCIRNPKEEPFQMAIATTATRDGKAITIPRNIGISQSCIRPVHTLQENQIHVSYVKPYPFTLGHFLYIWGVKISDYDVKVYINNKIYSNDSSYLDIVLSKGMDLRLDFVSKNKI